MIKIKRFEFNMLQENCYVVSDDTRQAVIVDCGAYYEEERQAIVNYIGQEQLEVKHLLCTHGHFDHCVGNVTIYQTFGLKPEVAAEDEWLMDMSRQMKDMMNIDIQLTSTPLGQPLTDGATISFGNHQLHAMSTPGHSPGGMCLYCEEEKVVFTGDTLFHQSVGRTDFERGSWTQLLQSLAKIARLPKDTTVYPGHGPQTTIGRELECNPYLRA